MILCFCSVKRTIFGFSVIYECVAEVVTDYFILLFGLFRQVRVAAASLFTYMKTAEETIAKVVLGLDCVSSTSSSSEDGYNPPQLNAAPRRKPSPTGGLDKTLDFLGTFSMVLGLFLGDTGGPKYSCTSFLKMCLAVLTVGFLSSSFIVIQCKDS